MKTKLATTIAGLSLGSVAALLWDWRPRPPENRGLQPSIEAEATGPDDDGDAVNDHPGPSRTRKRPPNLVVAGPSPRIETDPGSPAYDPTKLAAIGTLLPDIVAAEPRNATWAAPFEKMLSARLAHDIAHLSSRARLEAVDCRSSSCNITVDVPEEETAWVREAMMLARLGDWFQSPRPGEPPAAGWTRLSMPLLYGKQGRDLQTASRLQQERRKSVLEEWRKHPDELRKIGLDPGRLPATDYPSELATP